MDFEIFGLGANATDSDVEKAYADLKRKYRDQMFSEGEQGAEAARALEKINAEYRKFQESKKPAEIKTVEDLGFIEELVRQDKLDEAQQELDKIQIRSAEWHFVQGLVYYKKSWFLECRKQLEIAIQKQPDNKKYKENYLSLLAYSEIMQQKVIAAQQQSAPKGGDCCTGNNGSCTAPCIMGCCFGGDDEDKKD